MIYCLSVRHSNILSFADDTKCYNIIRNILDATLDLSSLFEWSIENQPLLFNINKCTILLFKSNSSSDANCYDNMCSKTYHRDLGVIFSSNLCWSAYYKTIISKAYIKILWVIETSFFQCTFNISKNKNYIYCKI